MGGRGVLVVGRMLVSLARVARPRADNYQLRVFTASMHLEFEVFTGPISARHQKVMKVVSQSHKVN
jgi:hypothetical protein